jgi:hypothetical protein
VTCRQIIEPVLDIPFSLFRGAAMAVGTRAKKSAKKSVKKTAKAKRTAAT